MRGALFMRKSTLPAGDMLADTEQALALVDALLAGDTIASLWSVEDVQGLRDDGTVDIDTARRVLKLAESEHDASIGINWETLGYWLDYVEGGEA
jgi:hypothetical protein